MDAQAAGQAAGIMLHRAHASSGLISQFGETRVGFGAAQFPSSTFDTSSEALVCSEHLQSIPCA